MSHAETLYFNDKSETLTTGSVITRAPAVAATTRCSTTSPRYTFVPTSRIVGALAEAGWTPVLAQQASVRNPAREGFQKHLVRFRLARQMNELDEYNVELLLTNAHDGSSAYVLNAGIFRRICKNGLVVSDASFEALRFPHRGLNPDRVAEGSMELANRIPSIVRRVGDFSRRLLSQGEQEAYAEEALALRYTQNPPVRAGSLLNVRRGEDAGNDLWRVYNRVQENLVRGGLGDGQLTRTGRRRSIRRINGISSSMKVNKGLWDLTEKYFAA